MAPTSTPWECLVTNRLWLAVIAWVGGLLARWFGVWRRAVELVGPSGLPDVGRRLGTARSAAFTGPRRFGPPGRFPARPEPVWLAVRFRPPELGRAPGHGGLGPVTR